MNQPFKVRNLQFPVDASRPRFWYDGQKAVSAFYDNLSVFFPKGERFFVASVIAHRHHVKDAALLEAVKAFCGQEGCHGREHERYNELLKAQGYPIGPQLDDLHDRGANPLRNPLHRSDRQARRAVRRRAFRRAARVQRRDSTEVAERGVGQPWACYWSSHKKPPLCSLIWRPNCEHNAPRPPYSATGGLQLQARRAARNVTMRFSRCAVIEGRIGMFRKQSL